MSKVVHKANEPSVIEKAGGGKDAYTFCISSENPDLVGDIVVQSGMKPVSSKIIAQVDHSNKISDLIGYWDGFKIVGKKTFADLNLFEVGISKTADFVRALLDRKIPMACSIGFKGNEYEPVDGKDPWNGLRYLKSTLLETSVVSVGCNSDAVSVVRSLNVSKDIYSGIVDIPEEETSVNAALRRAKNLLIACDSAKD